MPQTMQALRTDKRKLAHSRIDRSTLPGPAAGEILCRIDLLSLSSNNITYAAFGDSMQYWQFFPTGDPDFGQMPAWGYAEVVESGAPGIAVGERLFGYWPLATHAVLAPEAITSMRFVDGSTHRQPLVGVYNRYTRVAADPDYDPAHEGMQALLLPLFLTAWMLADQLRDQDFYGASRVLFSSASSKTAWLTAWCLRADAQQARCAGLTSTANLPYTRQLGLYDEVLDYARLPELQAAAGGDVYVDFSGDPALRAAVHRHLDEGLRQSLFAGSAQYTQAPALDANTLPGPKPRAFFAPSQVRKRNADWGAAEVARRFSDAQRTLYDELAVGGRDWIQLETHTGLDAAADLIRRLIEGRAQPQQGFLVRPGAAGST